MSLNVLLCPDTNVDLTATNTDGLKRLQRHVHNYYIVDQSVHKKTVSRGVVVSREVVRVEVGKTFPTHTLTRRRVKGLVFYARIFLEGFMDSSSTLFSSRAGGEE